MVAILGLRAALLWCSICWSAARSDLQGGGRQPLEQPLQGVSPPTSPVATAASHANPPKAWQHWQQAKTAGYFKIGLYSKLARRKSSRSGSKHGRNTPEDIRKFFKQVFDDDQHELKIYLNLRMTLFALRVPQPLLSRSGTSVHDRNLEKLLETEQLVFCGFMPPKSIKAACQHCFPEDTDGPSLSNWGEFESNNPSTFQGIY